MAQPSTAREPDGWADERAALATVQLLLGASEDLSAATTLAGVSEAVGRLLGSTVAPAYATIGVGYSAEGQRRIHVPNVTRPDRQEAWLHDVASGASPMHRQRSPANCGSSCPQSRPARRAPGRDRTPLPPPPTRELSPARGQRLALLPVNTSSSTRPTKSSPSARRSSGRCRNASAYAAGGAPCCRPNVIAVASASASPARAEPCTPARKSTQASVPSGACPVLSTPRSPPIVTSTVQPTSRR